MKYRKKPVVIEAFQMTPARRESTEDWPSWARDAFARDPSEGSIWRDREYQDLMYCGTLEGVHVVSPGDWIIKGIKGELYPCRPDIFEMTYELAESCAKPE